uniref:Uncharacterized protein n=1 Tax=Desulfobacca acetoxidans TaxID=60893 RepID=A0A7V4G7X3_9BACT
MGDIKKSSNGQALKGGQQDQKGLDTKETEIKGMESSKIAGLSQEAGDTKAESYQKVDQDLDNHVLNHLEVRYGEWIPPERLTEERQRLAQIRRKEALQQDLAEKFSDLSQQEREAVLGYCSGDERHIERNIQTPSTLLHERLHGLSHPEAKRVLGNHLYEGITEDLATQNPEFFLKLKDMGECYPENRETVTILKARVPESALYEAYFKGDDSRIRGFVDHDLGEGTWAHVKDLLEQAERGNQEALHEARKILKQNRWGS